MGPAAIAALGNLGKIGKAMTGVSAVMEVLEDIRKLSKSVFNAISKDWIEMQDIAFKTGRSMAMSREMAMRYDRQLMQTTKELARQYGITAKELAEFQKTYAENTGRNVTLTKQQTEAMAAMSKIAGEHASTLIDEYDKVGVGIERAVAYTGRLQERAKALGVSPAKATKMMADNIKLAASYSFKNGVADIEKMSLKAASMRLDMNAVMNASEKFANIEDAISTSANIQMLGGSFAQQFSNPMGAMYEAMADPKAFQDRIIKTIEGKGTYDSKTGEVKFDPITMQMMRETAKQLGMSVDQLTNPAMASIQNSKVEEELRAKGKWDKWSDVQKEAIKNLSRTNVDEETGKHYVTIRDVNGEVNKVDIEDLTAEQLKIAQDQQKTEEDLFGDVQEIKEILEDTLGRARGTTSTKENLEGLSSEWNAFIAQFQNGLMGTISGWLNGSSFQPWDLFKTSSWPTGQMDIGTHASEGISWTDFLSPFMGGTGPYAFAEGGLVKPIPHASLGAVIQGSSTMGDKTPVLANAGEMILNPREQKGLFDLLKDIAATGLMAYCGNKLGKRFGMHGIGTNMALSNIFSGGNLGIGGMLGQGVATTISGRMMRSMSPMGMMPMKGFNRPITLMNPTVVMNGKTIMNGNIDDGSLVEQFEDITDAVSDATKTTRSFSQRIRDLSRRNTFLGKGTKWYRKGIAAKLKVGRKINNLGLVKKTKAYNDFLGKSYYDSSVGRYRTSGKFVGKNKIGNLFTKGILRAKGFGRNLSSDLGLLKESPKMTGAIAETSNIASNAANTIGKSGKLISGVKGVGKLLGKAAGPIGSALMIGSTISDISSASSQYDAQINEIEKSNLSDLEKARAKDAAAKEKNKSIGGSVGGLGGGLAGAAAGAAIGSVIPGVGTLIGGAIGGIVGGFGGDFLGKGIGGLFGGGEEEKLKKEKEEIRRKYTKDSDADGKLLESINKNVEKIANGYGSKIHAKQLNVPSIANNAINLPVISQIGLAKHAFDTIVGGESPINKLYDSMKNTKHGKMLGNTIEALPMSGNFLKVFPSVNESDKNIQQQSGKADINLTISGTIKLDGGGKTVDFDINKLLDNREFINQLSDIINDTMNRTYNSGGLLKESSRNNSAKQYNTSGN